MIRPASLIRADCRAALEGREHLLEPLRATSILVTGGTGFVGAWVSEMLACLNDDWDFRSRVTMLARSPSAPSGRLSHLLARKDFRYLRQDVVFLGEIPRETNWLIHAAGTPDSRVHSTNPVETISTFVVGTLNVVKGLDPLSDFRRMLHLSSASVLGGGSSSRDGVPHGIISPLSSAAVYVEAKRCAEAVCSAARTQKRLPLTVARPFAFIGPYQGLDCPWALNNFLDDALHGRPIRVQGDGETVRSYLYGSDMAFWVLRMLSAEGGLNAVWNLGSSEAVTLRELAELVSAAVSPSPPVLLRTATGLNHPATRWVADLSAVESALGLDARVPLREAVSKTLSWHRASTTVSAP